MVPKRKKNKRKPSYPLKCVKKCVRDKNYGIRENASENAWHQLGWEVDDIEKAVGGLKPSHFLKTEKHRKIPNLYVDYYEVDKILSCSVYLHFYITDSGRLIINSLKGKKL